MANIEKYKLTLVVLVAHNEKRTTLRIEKFARAHAQLQIDFRAHWNILLFALYLDAAQWVCCCWYLEPFFKNRRELLEQRLIETLQFRLDIIDYYNLEKIATYCDWNKKKSEIQLKLLLPLQELSPFCIDKHDLLTDSSSLFNIDALGLFRFLPKVEHMHLN